jgi:hypothetical protein
MAEISQGFRHPKTRDRSRFTEGAVLTFSMEVTILNMKEMIFDSYGAS